MYVCLLLQLDVVGLNYVSRPWNDPLVLTTIDHVAFSPDGLWLATVSDCLVAIAPQLGKWGGGGGGDMAVTSPRP